ncbi:hypothetical protein CAAN1_12S03422 [[Candida] anglica]|uniref:Uncharacterized protein n=1 Tax=[Candida] anglica TaxID=148631 RepID=A0ABP0E6V3_9ASCO
MQQKENSSSEPFFRASNSKLVAPGSFSFSAGPPLNQIKTHENIYPPIIATATLSKSLGTSHQSSQMREGGSSRLSRKNCILQKPNPVKQRILITTPEIVPSTASIRNSSHQSITTNEDEVFYESSPVLPLQLNIPDIISIPNQAYRDFEQTQTNKFILDSSKLMEEGTFFPTLLQESFNPIVPVEITPMGRPLISNTMPLDLLSLIPDLEGIYLRKSAPFCTMYEKETEILLKILTLEFESLEEYSTTIQPVHFNIVTRFKQIFRGYTEEEYDLLYPWAKYFTAGDSNLDDEDSDFEENY